MCCCLCCNNLRETVNRHGGACRRHWTTASEKSSYVRFGTWPPSEKLTLASLHRRVPIFFIVFVVVRNKTYLLLVALPLIVRLIFGKLKVGFCLFHRTPCLTVWLYCEENCTYLKIFSCIQESKCVSVCSFFSLYIQSDLETCVILQLVSVST